MYDLINVDGSAAATAAGIYAARRKLNFKIVTTEFGGEVATSGDIENWPGIVHTNGIVLASDFRKHLKSYNVEMEDGATITKVEKMPDGSFTLQVNKAGNGTTSYQSRAVLITTGVHPRLLGIHGEKEFFHKGVTYCTTCDGPLFQDKMVATIGGGNSALESALMLNDIAKKVYVINRNPAFQGEQVLMDKVQEAKRIEIVYNANTTKIIGDQFVTGLTYDNGDGKEHQIDVQGVFVHIGMVPNSGFLDIVEKDRLGQIIVDGLCQTNISGLFAAGDVTNVPYKQIAIAAGQGVCAALAIIDYLNKQKA